MGALGNFGRSQARRVDPEKIRVTFEDVAGIDEAKAELTEIVDFLREPDKYGRLGGRMPHGVLLYGPPGTGKTLLARAVAGEAHAAFFSISASEFIEAIVGVGASRVRDLFAKAKEAAPAIIFIDELDAIGRSRAGLGVGHRRQRRARADARPDPHRAGRLRAGRGGRRARRHQPRSRSSTRPCCARGASIAASPCSRPTGAGGARSSRSIPARCRWTTTSTSSALAATTPGMVGADLANLANEAALLAARRGHDKVQMADFTDSLEKILLGALRGIVLGPADRERTAYHEGGHAIVGMLTPGADPVRKVSIIPRGQALGVTLSAPDSDRVSYTREELEAKIQVALGGRVAEEVVYGTITTGAESDIQQLTQIVRHMVGRWGMSERIGPVAVLPADGEGSFLPGASETSPETAKLVDDEVTRIVAEAHGAVTDLLTEHREQLETLARELLEHETLDAPEAYAAAGVPLPKPGRRRRAGPACSSGPASTMPTAART